MQLRNRNLDGASNLDGTEDMEEDEVPLIENEDPDVEIVDKKSVKSSQYFICLPNVTNKSSSKLSKTFQMSLLHIFNRFFSSFGSRIS